MNHIQPNLINLHPNEYSQEFYCFQFAVKLDIRCVGSCNTLNDLPNKVRRTKLFFPNKTEDLNLTVFNIIAGVNETITLKKHILLNVNFVLMKENVIQINGGITIYVGVSLKNVMYVKKSVF